MQTNVKVVSIGTLLICSQGFVNAIAMNEKVLQEFVKQRVVDWRRRRSTTGVSLISARWQSTRDSLEVNNADSSGEKMNRDVTNNGENNPTVVTVTVTENGTLET